MKPRPALAIATIAAQGIFIAGTVLGGAIERHGYRTPRCLPPVGLGSAAHPR
ncbi:hypothetical protein ACQPYH_16800 [Kribbella sp. CA-245084]|uniref:hypothetical protein n=1 Tax=Kribbella sp. CA-245084 TaxID=3239940 RepID=UPI003D8D3273